MLIRVGLTGGIASGKSLVGNLLQSKGWLVVDLDTEARRLTETDAQVRQHLQKIFGPAVLDPSGAVNRELLRQRVFEEPKLRQQWENVLHPRLMQHFESQAEGAESSGIPVAVCEAALLVETGLAENFDFVIVVTAPDPLRRQRLRDRNRFSEKMIEAIFAAQAPDEEKIRLADFHLTNHGDIAELEEQISKIANQILPPKT